MKIEKKTFILLIANLIILPLFGNENILNTLKINVLSTILNYILPISLALSLFTKYIKNGKNNKKDFIEIILFVIFITILLLSLIFSVAKEIYTISNFIKLTLCIFFIFILSKINFTNNQKKIIDYSILSLLLFTSILGILQYIFKFDITLAGIEKYPGANGRIKSTFYIATIFDKYLLISILYMIYLFIKRRINFILNLIGFVLGNIALSLTFCRSSLIIILAIYFILVIYCIAKKKYIISCLIILITIINYFIPGQNYLYSSVANYFKQITTTISEKTNLKFINNASNFLLNKFIIETNDSNNKDNDEENEEIDIQLIENIDYSIESRNYFKKIGVNVMKSNPLLGIGIGSYNYIYEKQNADKYISDKYKIDISQKYLYPHNMYVQLGAEIGILGMILFFIIIIFSLLKSKNIFSYLFLLIILLSCYSESIFYMKDIVYYTTFIIALFSNKNFLSDE